MKLDTIGKESWEKASPFKEENPDTTRKDKYRMPIDREMYKEKGLGGWVVCDHGNAIAYESRGKPVMGDDLLSSQVTTWYLPSCHVVPVHRYRCG